ncbi:hypothetical protein D3C86_1819480 [compost metagenome]
MLDRGLAERAEHVAAEAADKALAAGEPHPLDLVGHSGQHLDPGLRHQARHLLGLSALMLMIAQDADHGDAAGAQVFQQVLDLRGLAEIDQVAAQAQDVGLFMDLVEQVAVDAVRGLADMQVADGGDAKLLAGAGFHAGLRRLGV